MDIFENKAEIVVIVSEPCGKKIHITSENHQRDLSIILRYVGFHYARQLGWIEAELNGQRYYATRVVTLPFLYSYSYSAGTAISEAFYKRVMENINLASGAVDPDVWIAISAEYFCPLPAACVNLWESRNLKNTFDGAYLVNMDADGQTGVSINEIEVDTADKTKAVKKNQERKKKIVERFYQGWSVKDIMADQQCSESWVYKIVQELTGISAMEYRYRRWRMIHDLYLAVPRRSLNEISELCNVSHSQIYLAVKRVSERENTTLPEERRNKKLSRLDVENILKKLDAGELRKNICAEYSISIDTLIKYIGTNPDHRVIPKEFKEKVVRLRMTGKTLEQTSERLGVNISYVKRAWREVKNDPAIEMRREKYDNRNPLSKRDRDQAVNAVIYGGHTRVQIYKQYGINALTLRRYIRKALEKETEEVRKAFYEKKERKQKTSRKVKDNTDN